jgi:hypothetical protein
MIKLIQMILVIVFTQNVCFAENYYCSCVAEKKKFESDIEKSKTTHEMDGAEAEIANEKEGLVGINAYLAKAKPETCPDMPWSVSYITECSQAMMPQVFNVKAQRDVYKDDGKQLKTDRSGAITYN